MARSVLSDKGQTTIPKEIRDYLRAGPRDTLAYFPLADGVVKITAVKDGVATLKGLFARRRKTALSIDSMDAAIRTRRLHRGRA